MEIATYSVGNISYPTRERMTMHNPSPETFRNIATRATKNDLDIVVSTYYGTPEAEEKRVREIFRENIGFWEDFRDTAQEMSPSDVQAMMRGAVLLLGTFARREEIDQLKQSLLDQSTPIPIDLDNKVA